MGTILFNAFASLQRKLKDKNQEFANVAIQIPHDCTAADLINDMALAPEDVEAVFINGTVKPFDSILHDGDRIALVPPGTPGPYRVFLGMKNKNNRSGN